MQEYLLQFRGGLHSWQDESVEQRAERMQAWLRWFAELRAQGRLKLVERLHPDGWVLRGSTLEVELERDTWSDKPGGLLVLRAHDLEDAVRLARGCPILAHEDGSVEIRPVIPIETSERHEISS